MERNLKPGFGVSVAIPRLLKYSRAVSPTLWLVRIKWKIGGQTVNLIEFFLT